MFRSFVLVILYFFLISFNLNGNNFNFYRKEIFFDLFSHVEPVSTKYKLTTPVINITIPNSVDSCVKLDLQMFFDSAPTTSACGGTTSRCSNASIRSSGSNRIGFRGCITAGTAGQTLSLSSSAVYSMIQPLAASECNLSGRCCGLPASGDNDKVITCLRVYDNNLAPSQSEDTVVKVTCSGSTCELNADATGTISLSAYGNCSGGSYSNCADNALQVHSSLN